MDEWLQMSAVVAEHAAVSSDQPAASSIGIEVLKMGGNAADAAVATLCAVSVLQPFDCGVGGDCHCLFFREADGKVCAINGSGRSGKNATLEKIQSAGIVGGAQRDVYNHGLWVSVPGAVAGMCSVVRKFGSGKLDMDQILTPAIRMAEEGVPVPRKTALQWDRFKRNIAGSNQAGDVLNEGLAAPAPGEKIYARKLARVFRVMASEGAEGFYGGEIAENVVKEVQAAGGVLTLEDLREHLPYKEVNESEEALCVDFCGFRVWEMKPNATGIVTLVALNILQLYDLRSFVHNSAEYIHIVSEAIKYAFLECWDNLCDPSYNPDFKSLLSKDVSRRLKLKIDNNELCSDSHVITGSNTSYVAVVDAEGNGCSLICSIYSHFGASLIPENCGFVLHDRLKAMDLNATSPNVYGPEKLPLHTIIPSLVTDVCTNELLAVLGLCGRWMQPQGKIQVLLNMIVFGMDPQTALNQPRFFVGNGENQNGYNESLSKLTLEGGIPASVVPFLNQKGHDITHSAGGMRRRLMFGKGHVIARPVLWNKNASRFETSWWVGADPRTDGVPFGF